MLHSIICILFHSDPQVFFTKELSTQNHKPSVKGLSLNMGVSLMVDVLQLISVFYSSFPSY